MVNQRGKRGRPVGGKKRTSRRVEKEINSMTLFHISRGIDDLRTEMTLLKGKADTLNDMYKLCESQSNTIAALRAVIFGIRRLIGTEDDYKVSK